jgi:hypothetical protein
MGVRADGRTSTRQVARIGHDDFAVKQGRISGSVVLVVRAITRKASYDWQYSTDEETWAVAETTFQATTTLVGLAAGIRYLFRFCARTGEGLREPGHLAPRRVNRGRRWRAPRSGEAPREGQTD